MKSTLALAALLLISTAAIAQAPAPPVAAAPAPAAEPNKIPDADQIAFLKAALDLQQARAQLQAAGAAIDRLQQAITQKNGCTQPVGIDMLCVKAKPEAKEAK